jgi:hypothetical protein
MREPKKLSSWMSVLLLVAAAGCGDDDAPPGDDDDDDDDDVVLDARADSAAPGDAAIDGTTPGDAAIDGATPGDAAIDGTVAFDAAIDGAIPDDAAFDSSTPVDAAADSSIGTDAGLDPDAAIGDGGSLPAVGTHLLITEVDTVGADEFIEIYNPTDTTIALDDYYLADVNNYFRLPAGAPGLAPVDSDFVAGFPTGATIAPRGVVTVATDGPQFLLSYGFNATFAIDESGPGDTAMELTAGSYMLDMGISLTNGGEMVALFRWDGASDLVQDVDIAIAGNNPSAGNTLVAKTAVDGPDADDVASSYATDALTIGSLGGDTSSTVEEKETYKRIALESGTVETQGGTGNGITGDDETSEMIQMTWTSAAADHTAATPGTVPAALNP